MMDVEPVYRKTIPPWYDADALCWVLLLLLMAVFIFAVIGISTALADTRHYHHVWLPTLLASLATTGVLSITIRLIYRRVQRSRKEASG